MDSKLKSILDAFGIKPEEYIENMKESLDANSDIYRGLTPRLSKSFYRELSKYYSNKNKTTESFTPLNIYSEQNIKSEIYFKTEEPEVNQILEGGFKGGYVYEIIGPTGTGKIFLNVFFSKSKYKKKKNKNNLFFFFV